MRIYETEKHKETLYTIQTNLLNFMKTEEYLTGKNNERDAKIGSVSCIFSITYEL